MNDDGYQGIGTAKPLTPCDTFESIDFSDVVHLTGDDLAFSRHEDALARLWLEAYYALGCGDWIRLSVRDPQTGRYS